MTSPPAALDPISQEYVTIAFGIERLVPGFVDAYVGPPEVRATALDGDTPEPRRLLDATRNLLLRLADTDLPSSRTGYLTAQLGAMVSICRGLDGDDIDYISEVRHLFDIEPVRTPDEVFDAALAELDSALPGHSPAHERMEAWRRQVEINPDTALRLIDVIQPEIRRRTLDLVDLPPGEGIEFRLVSNQPWGGYNWYLGNGRSRVEINTDLPIEASHLTDLLCHEGYPGHHTEHALKERLFLDRGFGEHAIQLINTPECIISEGIATLAEEVLFGPDQVIAFRREHVYPAAGVAVDPLVEERVRQAQRMLRAVPGNAALMLHADGRPETEVRDYLMHYGVLTEPRAAKRLEFIANPLWRSYVFTYHAGYDLLGGWIDAAAPGDRRSRFRTLLTDQVYPSWIKQQLAGAGKDESDGKWHHT